MFPDPYYATDVSELMTDKHKDILTRNYDTLTMHLTADIMLNKLMAEGIITIGEHEDLLTAVTSSNRAGALLRLLLKKEDRAFYVLIQACKVYAIPYLAWLLDNEG